MSEKEDDNMAVRKEELKEAQVKLDRKELIVKIAERICNDNDEGLRRLSKN